jgi:two-component system phosphate regulon response regulator PhoB
MEKFLILFVEDEINLLNSLSYILEKENFVVIKSTSAEDALKIIERQIPDLILLDLSLPGMDGFEFAEIISQQETDIPIIILTGRSNEDDVIKGLEKYADEYLLKPVLPKIIIARIHSLLRRTSNNKFYNSIENSEFYIDKNSREVFIKNKSVELTKMEFEILNLLFYHKNHVFSRANIINYLHGGNYRTTNRSVDFQIYNLRKKLGKLGDKIQTIRGIGYKFKD